VVIKKKTKKKKRKEKKKKTRVLQVECPFHAGGFPAAVTTVITTPSSNGGVADFPLIHQEHAPHCLTDFRGLRFGRCNIRTMLSDFFGSKPSASAVLPALCNRLCYVLASCERLPA